MQPELHIGPLDLKTFGICFALAFVAAGLVGARRLRELELPVDWAYELIFAGLAGGFVGARVDYLLQNWDAAKNDLIGAAFSGSGLVWLGGVVGGTVGVLLWAWRRDFVGLALLDLCAPLLALGYAIGRVGCQVSGDGDYGKPSDLPWAMAYPDGTVPTDVKVHPTPIYETLAMGLVALLLWRLRDRVRPGILFALWLVLSGVERLLVEFIRRNDTAALGLTLPQLISVAMIAAGAVWLARARELGLRAG
ncbi:MAG: phosphatidylglycerol---prolipoprotein diacylglyceryl transferase [Thermoleophilaceae bacterium]|jgi:phosphatidylglycerol:prolipoprotein diacylglycerol transferase|nr:phosphatidylglycerol---prolipoprotein diacylglyceryl transferase [Thermoleophilaceae bacterium]